MFARSIRRFVPKNAQRVLNSTKVETVAQQAAAPVVTENKLLNRFKITAEVTISKIFPAGFMWQYGGSIASELGYTAQDVGFAFATGLGDMTGVAVGHFIYYAILKKALGSQIDVKKEAHVGIFLGSAGFCSGFMWQPTVNFFQGLELPFMGVAIGTWVTCGAAFFGGLRLFRAVYSPFTSIPRGDSSNFKDDAALSASIGGAAGAFVGTDVVYMGGEGNFLSPLVGVEATDSVLVGCTKAGVATGLGFAVAQSVQNVIVPTRVRSWVDA